VSGTDIVAAATTGAFDSDLLIYSMATDAVINRHRPDFNISGFDFNGVIVTVDGAEDLNFYKLDQGKIANHFFQVPKFRGSKFLSTVYLDHDTAYVYNSDELVEMSLNDSTVLSKLTDIPSFSQISMSSDETNLYLSIYDSTSTELKAINKSTKVTTDLVTIQDNVTSIIVDANYIYAVTAGDSIEVYNKHNQAASGTLSITGVELIDLVGDKLYAYRSDTQAVEVYTVSFN
jgi:hypothetical protein